MTDAILKKLEQHDLEFRGVNSNIAELKAGVSGLQTDVSILQTDVSILKTDVSILKTDVSILKTDISILKTDVSRLDTSFHRMELLMEDSQKTQQLILENVVSLHRQLMPREDIEARFQTHEIRISALEYSVSSPK